MNKIKINDEIINYDIEYKNIKNAYLRYNEGVYHVTASKLFSKKAIEKFVIENAQKLKNRVEKSEKREKLAYAYNNGDYIGYLGKKYKFEKIIGPDNIVLLGDKIIGSFKNDNQEYIIKMMESWYANRTIEIIEKIYDEVFTPFEIEGYIPSKITVKKLKSRWGSCNKTTREIVINSQLAKIDIDFIYFVLNHEACHLLYANHGPSFHEQLDKVYPLNKTVNKRLREYQL